MITNAQLRQAFLTPAMLFYFRRKLAPLCHTHIDARIEELLKYLNMSIHEGGDIPFTEEVDEVWHYWILETIEYDALCRKLHGGRFIHHSSIDYVLHAHPDATQAEFDMERGLRILSGYVLNYGPFTEDRVRYWPLVGHLLERMRCDLDTLNAWLASVHAPRSRRTEPPTLETNAEATSN